MKISETLLMNSLHGVGSNLVRVVRYTATIMCSQLDLRTIVLLSTQLPQNTNPPLPRVFWASAYIESAVAVPRHWLHDLGTLESKQGIHER